MLVGRVVQAELVEDASHVPFHGGYRDHQFVRDARIGAALGDQLQNLPLTWRQVIERARFPLAADQQRDYIGIEHRSALGDPAHRIGERPEVADFLPRR